MPCNNKMGNGVMGGAGEGRDERFGGEGESLWCVFEWKYMMYCVSL